MIFRPVRPESPRRSTHDETSRRVDVKLRPIIQQIGWNDLFDDFFPDRFMQDVVRDVRVVLRGYHNGIHPHRLAVLVLRRHLRFSVRAQKIDRPILADLRQSETEPVSHGDAKRHQLFRLIAGITEHHPLVTCAPGIDTLGDGHPIAG